MQEEKIKSWHDWTPTIYFSKRSLLSLSLSAHKKLFWPAQATIDRVTRWRFNPVWPKCILLFPSLVWDKLHLPERVRENEIIASGCDTKKIRSHFPSGNPGHVMSKRLFIGLSLPRPHIFLSSLFMERANAQKRESRKKKLFLSKLNGNVWLDGGSMQNVRACVRVWSTLYLEVFIWSCDSARDRRSGKKTTTALSRGENNYVAVCKFGAKIDWKNISYLCEWTIWCTRNWEKPRVYL